MTMTVSKHKLFLLAQPLPHTVSPQCPGWTEVTIHNSSSIVFLTSFFYTVSWIINEGETEHCKKSRFSTETKDMIYREVHCSELKSTSPKVPQQGIIGNRPEDMMVGLEGRLAWIWNQLRYTPGKVSGLFVQGLITWGGQAHPYHGQQPRHKLAQNQSITGFACQPSLLADEYIYSVVATTSVDLWLQLLKPLSRNPPRLQHQNGTERLLFLRVSGI